VFYNPAMRLDRDLGVAVARAWAAARDRPASGWEVAAATGVRGLRLLHESGAFDRFLLTETHPAAVAVLEENARTFPGASARAADGRVVPPGAPFDWVDVDPFGSPLDFLPASMEATAVGGLLAVTATDMMVLGGAQPAAALRRYGARPVRGRLGPEGGLRILLAFLASAARARGRTVRPLLAYVHGHHVRAYVTLEPVDPAPDPVASIDPTRWTGPRLEGTPPLGPLWVGPLFDRALVARLAPIVRPAAGPELAAWIGRVQEEAAVDRPFYYEPNSLASDLRLPYPPSLEALRQGLVVREFVYARTHARPEGFRTDAPRSVVEEVARSVAPAGQSQNARVRA